MKQEDLTKEIQVRVRVLNDKVFSPTPIERVSQTLRLKVTITDKVQRLLTVASEAGGISGFLTYNGQVLIPDEDTFSRIQIPDNGELLFSCG